MEHLPLDMIWSISPRIVQRSSCSATCSCNIRLTCCCPSVWFEITIFHPVCHSCCCFFLVTMCTKTPWNSKKWKSSHRLYISCSGGLQEPGPGLDGIQRCTSFPSFPIHQAVRTWQTAGHKLGTGGFGIAYACVHSHTVTCLYVCLKTWDFRRHAHQKIQILYIYICTSHPCVAHGQILMLSVLQDCCGRRGLDPGESDSKSRGFPVSFCSRSFPPNHPL